MSNNQTHNAMKIYVTIESMGKHIKDLSHLNQEFVEYNKAHDHFVNMANSHADESEIEYNGEEATAGGVGEDYRVALEITEE